MIACEARREQLAQLGVHTEIADNLNKLLDMRQLLEVRPSLPPPSASAPLRPCTHPHHCLHEQLYLCAYLRQL